ncbi:hypothetical protein Tco_0533335 [Tanacetum coccineum]
MSTNKVALEEYDLKSALYQSMHANKSFNRNPANHRLYHALMEAFIEDENAMDKGVANTVKDHKRKHDDDEDPPARPNQGKKTKKRITKESESFKRPSSTQETPKGKAPTKGSKTGKSASAKDPVVEPIAKVVMDDVGDDVARDDNQPQDTSEPKTRKTLNPDWFKQPPRPLTPDHKWNKLQCFNALTDKLDWNNPEGDRYPFDLSKSLPLQGPPGHRTIDADYFFNNDLEYLKTSDLEVTYTLSITKTKMAQCEKGIKHWGERRKLWYRSQVGKFSKHNVYSTKEILGVKSVKGNFVDLHLNDIEDMLLLVVQHKLFYLDGSVIADFIVALQIRFKEPYTPSYDPPGIIYEDLNKQKRVLRADELYKFSDGTPVCLHSFITEYLTFVWITTRRCQRESGQLLTERDRVL